MWRWWATGPGWEGRFSPTTPEGDNLHRNIAREKTLVSRYRDAWQTGGGTVWNTPAFDPTRHLMLFGTSNPAPMNDGSMRPGDNLYTDSVVALDYRTGKLVWYFQEVPHDVWDYDASSPVVLFSLQRTGQTIPVAAEAGKDGFVYVLDERNGHEIARSPLVVPAINHFVPPTPKGVLEAPIASGGMRFSPMAYSPDTGYLYLVAVDAPRYDVVHPGQARRPPALWEGSGDPYPAQWPTGRSGNVTAVDPATGRIVWQVPTARPMIGGVAVTSTGLVFMGRDDGTVIALDAKTGRMLWHDKTGAAGANATPVIYEVNGREQVAIGVGGNFTMFSKYGDAFYTFGVPQPGEAGPVVIGTPPAQPAAAPAARLTAGQFVRLARAPGWMQVDAARKIVRFAITPEVKAEVNPFNFNGFASGQLQIVVPKGWLVQVLFTNAGGFPHSLEVVRAAAKPPLQGGPPAFDGAATPDLDAGLPPSKSAAFQFLATMPGRFWIMCGVPGHAISGMWDSFTISATAAQPSIVAH